MTAISASEVFRGRLTPRSVATRAKLISVAEQLFAARGVEGVTLAEIGKLAGQRNAAVCQYHFGGRDSLLQAIIDKHVPGIVARRHLLLDEIEHVGQFTLRDVVRAFVRPVAEKLTDPDGGRDFIRINAQLVALHTVHAHHVGPSPLRLPANDRLVVFLGRAMAGQDVSMSVLRQRTMLAAVLLFHGLADHLRMLELANSMDASMNTDLFLHTLEEAIVAILQGPARSAGSDKLAGERGRIHGG